MALFGLLAHLLNNLIRAGRSQAGDDTHGQGGQRIGCRKIRHVDMERSEAEMLAQQATTENDPNAAEVAT